MDFNQRRGRDVMMLSTLHREEVADHIKYMSVITVVVINVDTGAFTLSTNEMRYYIFATILSPLLPPASSYPLHNIPPKKS